MGKEILKRRCAMHMLILSVALNVGLLLRLTYTPSCTDAHVSSQGLPEKARVSNEVTSPHSFQSSITTTGTCESGGDLGDDGRIIDFEKGDPTMYEGYWREAGEKATVVIQGWQSLSYFSDPTNICWFLEPQLAAQIIRLHRVAGNAVTGGGRHLVVGTGATQLFQAALHALSPPSPGDDDPPASVVCATPYYSFYKDVVDYIQSRLYTWVGDVSNFNGKGSYIEIVTSPNNPDGLVRQPSLNHTSGGGGTLIHDFAYYWPQYTPITAPADQDIMLFTASKVTGHAGMRIGWALVKNKEVAERMTKFVVINSIGVSKDSQLRGAKILEVVSNSAERKSEDGEPFFEFSHRVMAKRWSQLREVVKHNKLFSIPELPSAFCNFFNKSFKSQPAFAWVKCEGDVEDCEGLFKAHNVLSRGGRQFGVSPRFVRISMVDRNANFNLFLMRLSKIRH